MANSFSLYYFESPETVCRYLPFSFKGLIVSFGLMLQVLVSPMFTQLNKKPYISLAAPKPPNLSIQTYKCSFNRNSNTKLQYKPLSSV